MYAIIETGGKQIKVEVDSKIYIEKIIGEEGSEVTFDKVVMIGGDGTTKFGTPYVDGASVLATIQKQGKEKKVLVFKYKSKANYRRIQGHRQPYTCVVIKAINA